MNPLRWLARNWGQMLCFGVGGWLVAISTEQLRGDMYGFIAAGAVFMFTGLGLRALAIWRERR